MSKTTLTLALMCGAWWSLPAQDAPLEPGLVAEYFGGV